VYAILYPRLPIVNERRIKDGQTTKREQKAYYRTAKDDKEEPTTRVKSARESWGGAQTAHPNQRFFDTKA
jgi:hypothetical protein